MAIDRTYENSVFINCPFDPTYWPLFEAITFSVMQCGFVPRCALEVDDSSQVRIEKINSIIKGCRLAIHDISRTETDGTPPLPRFNMPLELGMFLGAKAFGGRDQKRKAAVILDTEQYRYQKYISDIAGQDIRAHGGDPARVIGHVRNFLASHVPTSSILPGPERVTELYQLFHDSLPTTCKLLHLDPTKQLMFGDLTKLIRGFLTV